MGQYEQAIEDAVKQLDVIDKLVIADENWDPIVKTAIRVVLVTASSKVEALKYLNEAEREEARK